MFNFKSWGWTRRIIIGGGALLASCFVCLVVIGSFSRPQPRTLTAPISTQTFSTTIPTQANNTNIPTLDVMATATALADQVTQTETVAAVASPAQPVPTQRLPTQAPPTLAPPTVASPSSNCEPAYPDICLPIATSDTLDCGDVPHARFRVLPPDPYNLDGNDKDGIGCESN